MHQTVRQRFSQIEHVSYVGNKDISQPIVQAKEKVEDTKVAKAVRTNKAGTDQEHKRAIANLHVKLQDLKVTAIAVVCMGTRERHADGPN